MTGTMVEVSISFLGVAGDPLDAVCRSIFEQHGGEFIGCGTRVPCSEAPWGERDMQYAVPEAEVAAVRTALKRVFIVDDEY